MDGEITDVVASTSAIIIGIAANHSILTAEASEVAWRRRRCPLIANLADRRAASLNRTEWIAGASARGEARTDVEDLRWKPVCNASFRPYEIASPMTAPTIEVQLGT